MQLTTRDRGWDWILVVGREPQRGGHSCQLKPLLRHRRGQDVRHRGGPLEKLNTEKVSNEGSRGAEDEDPGFLLSSGIESVPWVKK